MKLKLLLSLLIMSSFNLFAADNTLTEKEKADGWKLLFDGKTIEHWRNFRQKTISDRWTVENGLMTKKKGGGDIITKEQYENFEFKLDWKIAKGGNSGVFILADEEGKGKIYAKAPEIQLLDDSKYPGPKYEKTRSGSLYAMVAAPAESQKATGEWNTMHITINKGQLTVIQNGIKAVDIKINGDKWKELRSKSKFKKWAGFGENTKGHLGLQEHGSEIRFKNLKIKVLK